MTTRPDWAPPEVDLDRPSAARMYDYTLGGSHNFAADRQLAEQIRQFVPEGPEIARANRAFLRRAVRFLIGEGVCQFLDLGSGIPTVGNVHEVAQQTDPEARVVYVDNDPVAVAHTRSILAGDERAAVVHADLLRPDDVLAAPEVRGLLDLTQPVGLLTVSVLHFVSDDAGLGGVLARYRDAVVPGSYLALSHGTHETDPEREERAKALYARSANPLTVRTREEITALFDGFDLVEPGVVWLPQWRPDSPGDVDGRPERFLALAGAGRKP